METILLTGANGLLGQKITKLSLDRPAIKLIATSKGNNKNPLRGGYLYHPLDITDFNELQKAFEKFKPTAVINSAAMTNVDACELNPDQSKSLNVSAVQSLCELCKIYNARLIHISTDFIFDGEKGPYKETDKPNPLSVYGKHKLDAENIVLNASIPHTILRTVLLYGTVPDLSRTNIVLWVKDSLTAQKNINVVTDQFRTPTFAEDLADGVMLVLLNKASGIYNISGAEQFSIHDIATRVADFWKLDKTLITPTSSQTLSQPAKRPPKTGFIILKAQSELNYPPHTFFEGLTILDRQLKD